MKVAHDFVALASIIGEPNRARMLWQLLDGRAYTAGELAISADISLTAASNHLNKLLAASLLKVEHQGRYRYYSFAQPEIAYVIESMANLVVSQNAPQKVAETKTGVEYCRTCYDHLADKVGVCLTQALIEQQVLEVQQKAYLLTQYGWQWFEQLGITKEELTNAKRSFSRQCLDWSERKPHLAGHLGAMLLKKMLALNWFRRVQFSREMIVTTEGQRKIYQLLKLAV